MIRINNGILRALQLCEGSQKEVAEKIGTTRAYISGIVHNCSGYCPISLKRKLLEAFPILNFSDFDYYSEIEGIHLSRDKVMSRLIIKYNYNKIIRRKKNGNKQTN